MTVTTTFSLIDGGLIADPTKNRAALLARMAGDLVRYNTHGEERAAIRTLSGLGHAQGDIVMLVDDACRLAQEMLAQAHAKVAQDAVAAEMAAEPLTFRSPAIKLIDR